MTSFKNIISIFNPFNKNGFWKTQSGEYIFAVGFFLVLFSLHLLIIRKFGPCSARTLFCQLQLDCMDGGYYPLCGILISILCLINTSLLGIIYLICNKIFDDCSLAYHNNDERNY